MPSDLPNVARVAVEGTFNSERFVNVLHFFTRDASPWAVSDLNLLIGILDDAAADDDALLHIYEQLDSGCVIDTITATTLDNTTPAQVSATVSLAGTAVAADLPPMLALVVKWGTAVASRKYRGRTFLTGINAAFIDATNSDRFAAATQSDVAVPAQEFVTQWGLHADYGFCVLSATDRNAMVATPFQEVLSASVNPLVCVQRRRRERP